MQFARDFKLGRLAPLSGVVFIALIAVGRIIGSEYPDADASISEAVAFWTNNADEQMVIAFAGALSTLFLVTFAAVLRDCFLRQQGSSSSLTAISFGGAIVASLAVLLQESIVFTAAESAGDVPDNITQTMSVLQAEFFLPLMAGFAIFHLGTGAAVVHTGALPKWLGWVSIVTGILWLTPLFFGILLTVLWILAVSVLLFVREIRSEGATATRLPGAPICHTAFRLAP